MIAAIVAAEVGFWVLLVGGLTLRYVIRARRASTWALAAVPLVDLALVVFVSVDIARGAEPTQPHALAAVYLGFTVAFGHSVIGWADARFRHRFDGGPKPVKAAKGSPEEVRALWVEWLRAVLASVVAAACLGVMILVEGERVPSSVEQASQSPYWGTMLGLGVVCGIWFVAGPAFSRPMSPRRSAGRN